MLDINGAVEAEWPDEGVAAHYGDPVREQRGLAEGQVLVDRTNRGVVKVTGQDRLSWLHSLTSQHLERLAPGSTEQALVLSPQGHLEHHLTLTDDGTVDVKHCLCSYSRCTARTRSGARRWSRTRAARRACR